MWRLLRLYLSDEGFPAVTTTGEPELLADLQDWLAELYPLPGPTRYYPDPYFPPAEPGVAIVTKSIGSGKDYSTPATWAADLDNSGVYSAADRAVGEMYDNYTASLTITQGTTIGLSDVHLTVANGYQHDGTAGSGVVWTGGIRFNPGTYDIGYWVSWLEVTGASATYGYSIGPQTVREMAVWNCVVHDNDQSLLNDVIGIQIGATTSNAADTWCVRNILYTIRNSRNSNTRNAVGIRMSQGNSSYKSICVNNTVMKVEQTGGGTAYARGIEATWNSAQSEVQNNIATDSYSAGGGETDYDLATSTTKQYNLSSDTSATGTGSLTSKTSANQFTSTTSGFEDLHLLSSADAKDVGNDLGTTYHGAEIDIDGRDVDASADTWDMGADEYVAVASAAFYVVGSGVAGESCVI